MQGGVEVSVELVHKHVKTGDLLSHGAGDLNEKQPVVINRPSALNNKHFSSLRNKYSAYGLSFRPFLVLKFITTCIYMLEASFSVEPKQSIIRKQNVHVVFNGFKWTFMFFHKGTLALPLSRRPR